ncbi:hypothetical protein BJX76DRAFT_348886 [Aspergillus varians]
MVDFIAFHSYYSHQSFLSPSNMIPRPTSHKRSLSSGNRTASPDKQVTKAKSTNDLTQITTITPASAIRSSSEGGFTDNGFSTLKDPRIITSPQSSASSTPPWHHPDLNDEVATLSSKLVQAINNQTKLDDTLIATRQELEQAQERVCALETENTKYRQDIDEGVFVRKADVDDEFARLKASLAEETSQHNLVEKEKKGIEQELETLTAALFEEANRMVAAAKLEREVVEKKNEQLRSQIKDTESLLASHQEQLAELKSVLHVMNISRDDLDGRTAISTAPPSPAGPLQPPIFLGKSMETTDIPGEIVCAEIAPGPSTSFPNLIKTVCRTDLLAYEDFRELFTTAKSSKPPSRATSGSYSGLNVMSLASFGGAGFSSASSSPSKSQPHSPNGSAYSPQPVFSSIPLKDARFYKRALMEDIEPTLRLDAAPGISWLTRRSVLSGICEGSLVVEPVPSNVKKYEFPCSLCGERRSGSENERTHRFRTSDSETAQRYPLCVLCLERVRSCCEFTGYLRLILDGHIHAEEPDELQESWEETVRLRERMFWSRIGGGVVPIFAQTSAPGEQLEERQSDISPSIEKPVVMIEHSDIQNTTLDQEKIDASTQPLTADAMT